MFTTKTVVGTILLFTARNITYLSLFVRFHTQLIHLRTTMCTMFRQQVQYKNSKTGTYLIRESEAAQADSLYHISGTQYTWSCVRYIFIFIPSDKSRNEAFDRQPSLSHLCTPTVMNSIKWRCTCMQTLELYGRTTFPAPFFQCSTLIHSTTGAACSWWLDNWLVRERAI